MGKKNIDLSKTFHYITPRGDRQMTKTEVAEWKKRSPLEISKGLKNIKDQVAKAQKAVAGMTGKTMEKNKKC